MLFHLYFTNFLAHIDKYCHNGDRKLWPSLVRLPKVVCMVLSAERKKHTDVLPIVGVFLPSSHFVIEIFEVNSLKAM